MPMQPWERVAAGGAVVGGVAVAGWAGYKAVQQHLVAQEVVAPQLQVGGGPFTPGQVANLTVTASWTNGSSGKMNYGVQGVIVSGGVVVGHLWVSASQAQQATAAYNAGNQAEAAAMATTAAYRVQVLGQTAGGQCQAPLYGDPSIASGMQVMVWIQPNPPTTTLLLNDPVGKIASRLVLAGAALVTAQVA